jgi:hypothetical protein
MADFLLLRVTCDNEWVDDPAVAALVAMDPEYASLLLGRIKLAADLKAKEPGFYGLEFWSCAPTWVGWNDTLAAHIEDGTVILSHVPDGILSNPIRVDCVTMNVTEDDVFWTAYQKYTGARLSTWPITKAELKEWDE